MCRIRAEIVTDGLQVRARCWRRSSLASTHDAETTTRRKSTTICGGGGTDDDNEADEEAASDRTTRRDVDDDDSVTPSYTRQKSRRAVCIVLYYDS